MNIGEGVTDPHDLLKIAAKARQLASHVWLEREERWRLSGRLIRVPNDVGASCEAVVQLAKTGFFADIIDVPQPFTFVLLAIAKASEDLWGILWDDKHPDRIGEACDGEDLALRAVWRQRVRDLIHECHLGEVLNMSAEQLVAKLPDDEASGERGEMLWHWLSDIKGGYTPST